MKFWDSSAITPLLIYESSSGALRDILTADMEMLVWWGSSIECVSALARREREGLLAMAQAESALSLLRHFADSWEEIAPSDAIRNTAQRLLRTHALRAADSVQLAAAIAAANHDAAHLEFVCLDDRLAAAARREGFVLIDPRR